MAIPPTPETRSIKVKNIEPAVSRSPNHVGIIPEEGFNESLFFQRLPHIHLVNAGGQNAFFRVTLVAVAHGFFFWVDFVRESLFFVMFHSRKICMAVYAAHFFPVHLCGRQPRMDFFWVAVYVLFCFEFVDLFFGIMAVEANRIGPFYSLLKR